MARNSRAGFRRGQVWKGTLSFGLVSIPIEMVTARTSRSPKVKFISPEGHALKKSYFCSDEAIEVETDELTRGYEFKQGHFVEVTDEELEGLAPEKSQDISIDKFVPLSQIGNIYFDKSFYVLPARKSSGKPYLLLQRSLEETGYAALASFVMRGREQIIATYSHRGILYAQTLHYQSDIRGFEEISPARPKTLNRGLMKSIKNFIADKTLETIPTDQLVDPKTERLRTLQATKSKALAKQERKSNRRLSSNGKYSGPSEVIDIMDVIQKRLALKENKDRPSADLKELKQRTKDDLYKEAQQLDLSGRSSMTKSELINAIRKAKSQPAS